MALSGSQSLKRKLDTAGIDVKDDDRRDRCYKCGGRGHMQKECSSDPKAGNELSCYKCQGKGHFARSCPNLTRDVCYFCGTMGHHGLDCPLITRMFGNLPPIKRKELMSKMHSNPQFASQIMREVSTMSYGDPYSNLLASANPLQTLIALMQQPGGLSAAAAQLGLTAGGAQPALYANPYNQQTQAQAAQAAQQSSLGQYANYGETAASQSASAAGTGYSSAYGTVPGSPSHSASSQSSSTNGTYSAPPSLYSAAQANPFAGADVLSTLRALSGGFPGAAAGFGAGVGGYGTTAAFGGGHGHGGAAGSGNCFKCGQAGHFARECPNAPADGGVLCYRCGQPGHMAKDCSNQPLPGTQSGNESCFRCGERGHFSRDCVKNGAVPSKDSCFRCGQPGHRTRECNGPDIRVCFVCKQPGHVSNNCPDRVAR